MPSAFQTIRAGDFPATASDVETSDETAFADTSYTLGGTTVGTTFVAPTSGAVIVLWSARFESNTAAVRALVTMEVREGSTIGSGAQVSATGDASALESHTQARQQAGTFRYVSGLTAGDTYNVSLWHRISGAGTGDVFDRSVAVIPVP